MYLPRPVIVIHNHRPAYAGFDGLVLMDCQMPVLDGLEATLQIRDVEHPYAVDSIPILALTANALQGERERRLAAGMNDYIVKPVPPSQIESALQRWLPHLVVAPATVDSNAPAK
ncbi:MAG: response regulator [Rhodothermales bacterium]|nr:response regulator [Rhodothermales bacterium]